MTINTLPIVPTSNIHEITLREFSGPVLDQGPYGTCMENALVSMLDIQMREAGHAIAPLSRMQSYYDTREAQGTVPLDSGSSPEVTFNQAMTKGIAYESSWAYDGNLMYTKPGSIVYTEAAHNTVLSVSRLTTETQANIIENGVNQMLSQGKPVLMAFKAEPWFMAETGPLTSQPGYGENAINPPGHAALIIGASDNGTSDIGDDYAIIKNSWGTGWGDNGYGKMLFTEMQGDVLGLYVVNGFQGRDFTYTQERNDIAELYVALLNRAPDHTGQDWWAAVEHSGRSQGAIANDLLACPEEQIVFPSSSTNQQFIDTVYVNVLDRAAGTDSEGRSFWVNALNSGASRGDILVDIIDCTQSYVNGSNPQYNTDAIHSKNYFNDRVDAAMHFGVAYQSDNLDVAKVALVGVTDNYSTVNSANLNVAHLLGYL